MTKDDGDDVLIPRWHVAREDEATRALIRSRPWDDYFRLEKRFIHTNPDIARYMVAFRLADGSTVCLDRRRLPPG